MVQRADGKSTEGDGGRDVDQLGGERVHVGGDFSKRCGLRPLAGQLFAGRFTYRQHLFDGPDSGDRFLGKIESQRYRAHQASVDINRTATHALHDAGLGQRTSRKARQNDGLAGPHIFEHAQDLNLEFLDFVALEDSPSDGMLAGADVAQREDGNLAGREPRAYTYRENQ